MFTCPSCGRREVVNRWAKEGARHTVALMESMEQRKQEHMETIDLFDQTVKNLLSMPPMPRKRRKA